MSDTTDLLTDQSVESQADGSPAKSRRRSGGGLTGMLLPELQSLAGELGITGTGRMRKSDLIAAIKARQGSGSGAGSSAGSSAAASQDTLPVEGVDAGGAEADGTRRRGRRAASRPAGSAAEASEQPAAAEQSTATEQPVAAEKEKSGRGAPAPRSAPAPRDGDRAAAEPVAAETAPAAAQSTGGGRGRSGGEGRTDGNTRSDAGNRSDKDSRADNRNDNRSDSRADKDNRNDNRSGGRGDNRQSGQNANNDDDTDSNGRRRPRRFRDRNRRGRDRGDRFDGNNDDATNSSSGGTGNRGGRGGENRSGGGNEPDVREDDVLIPVAGIVDILDNYAFVRTSGYLTGPTDVYVSLSQIRRNGLRRGDHVTGAVRQPREGERRDKYNALVRLDSVNGLDIERAKNRPEFHKLTPLYPQDRLRLETESNVLTTRVIDLVMPIGKGQRALIVSPPKAGKTMVLQSIANAITTNNPECYLMVVLVDERPEEVTDMQRSVKGEVIASTFDRPPSDHTSVAELSIDRAKRLVELGHDVVVLLDSITRLGRAYNNASPASGRILSGGIDSTALYPPKRFLGAARNIENGGSLTIIATALVETGSTGDTVIFEEFKGTGNAELKLDRKIADKRIFPAVDVDASSTRKEEILLSPDELAIVIKLRRVLHALDQQQAIELVLDQLRKTKTNIEFLMQIQKTTPGSFGQD